MKQNYKMNTSNQSKRAVSVNPNIVEALQEIKQQLGDDEHSFIIFFSSSSYNPDELSKEFYKTFPNIQTFGCTTAGEIFGGELYQNSIVAMAFNKKIIKSFHLGIIQNMDDIAQVKKIFQHFSENTGEKITEQKPQKYVGILITEGIKGFPEKIISRINEITEIPFIGGLAGDDWQRQHTYIYANGKYYENAALMVILEPVRGYKILKTQSFEPIGEVFTATEVDEEKRCIKTINNIPAALFYAKQIGVEVEELKEQFINYSIGHIIYDEAYLHDSINFDDKYNLYLYSPIPQGAEVQILKITDIIKDIDVLIEKEIKPLKDVSAILNFNCGSRYLKIKKDKQEKIFKNLFKDLPAIGFATYGEFFISFINQTSTILVVF